MNEIYAEMIVFEPNVMNFDLSRLIEHFWYNLLYKVCFLDLAVAKSLQSTRMVTDADDADDDV